MGSIATAILGFILKLGFGGIVDKTLAHMEAKANSETERERIRSTVAIETIRAGVASYQAEQETRRALAAEGTTRQMGKMNFPVFWFIIIAALGPGVLTMWSLWAYNVFWWSGGMFPQTWAIAAFPPQSAAWVNLSIEWLFDPVGLASSVGTAAAGGLLVGRK